MKKNRFIKLASGLLVLCLMTTCVIGATLAKYTTAKDTQDSARVAKWGVRITAATNSAFKTEYNKKDSSTELSVQSSSTDKVVAPGTSGSAAQFSISGKPEVAVRLSFAMTDVKEVKLTAGTYTYTDGTEVIVPEGGYYPIKWTLNDGSADVATGTLGQIATFLSTHTVDYAPGTDLSTTVPTYTLSWEWDFEKNVASMAGTDEDKAAAKAEQDKLDTLLGDLAVGVSGINKNSSKITANDYSTEVSYKLTITATQID